MSVQIYATEADARRALARIDAALGYPRTHRDDDPGVQRGRGVPPPFTLQHTVPLLHVDGRAAIIIDPVIASLHGRQVVVDGRPEVIDATPTAASLPTPRDWEPTATAVPVDQPSGGGRAR